MGHLAYLAVGKARLPGDGPFAGDEYSFGRRAAADREGELLHRLRHQTVEGESPSLAGNLDQAGFPQDAQVVGDGRLRQPEEAGQVAGAHLAPACELVHDRHPRRIGERLEPLCERLGRPLRERRRTGGTAGLFEDTERLH